MKTALPKECSQRKEYLKRCSQVKKDVPHIQYLRSVFQEFKLKIKYEVCFAVY